ncbi:hypothetical protein [Ottowia sp.]|uniref:hypothetical protein n=1 Tax=Ottowia sp. TaxID=1898956 RepID=UPI0025E16A3B|nr:hypothetical protein [Ottowia sp.]MBK6616202.1 hypothetical protein [Ottowia sp.]
MITKKHVSEYGSRMMGILLLAMHAVALAGDRPVFFGLGWGEGLAEIKQAFGTLEPDVCSRSDKGYFETKGWSCEGYKRPAKRIADFDFDVHVHLSESTYTLAGLTLKAVDSGQSGRSKPDRREALVGTCETLRGQLSKTLGPGAEAMGSRAGQDVLTMHRWEAPQRHTSATLICRHESTLGSAEIQLELSETTRQL